MNNILYLRYLRLFGESLLAAKLPLVACRNQQIAFGRYYAQAKHSIFSNSVLVIWICHWKWNTASNITARFCCLVQRSNCNEIQQTLFQSEDLALSANATVINKEPHIHSAHLCKWELELFILPRFEIKNSEGPCFIDIYIYIYIYIQECNKQLSSAHLPSTNLVRSPISLINRFPFFYTLQCPSASSRSISITGTTSVYSFIRGIHLATIPNSRRG